MEAIEQFFSRISYGKVLKALSSLFFVAGVALLLKGTMVPELYLYGIGSLLIGIALFSFGEIIVTLKAILHRLDNKL
jgi:hypothetical protein